MPPLSLATSKHGSPSENCMPLPFLRRHSTVTVAVQGRPVQVNVSPAAARELGRRTEPLYLELELYFSCLVKKFVHFHDAAPRRDTVRVTDKLHLYFRAVTSTARRR